MADKPALIKRLPRAVARAHRADPPRTIEQRLESLLAVDDGVDEIIDALRQAGELENTLVIFTSDNGFFHGEHRISSGKAQVYEPAIRVPLLMRGPGITPGRRPNRIAGNVDLAPTILEAAGRPTAAGARRALAAATRARTGFALARLPAARGRRPAGSRLRRNPHPALRLRRAPSRAARALRPQARPVPAAQRAQVARLRGGARRARAAAREPAHLRRPQLPCAGGEAAAPGAAV